MHAVGYARRLAGALCVSLLAAGAAAAPSGATNMKVLDTLGRGELQMPFGVAVEPNGEIYVTDMVTGRVENYSTEGAYTRGWTADSTSLTGIAYDPAKDELWVAEADDNGLECYGTDGTAKEYIQAHPGDYNFAHPVGVVVKSPEDVYTTSTEWNRVVEVTPTAALEHWGQWGQHPGDFMYPQGIAIGPDGSVYVADLLNKKIKIFDPADYNKVVRSFDVRNTDGAPVGPDGIALYFDAATQQWTLLVVIQELSLVQQYTLDGPSDRKPIDTFGQGVLNHPWGIGVADDGTVTVADTYNGRLVRFVRG